MQRCCTPYLWLQSLLQFLREKGGFDVRSVIKFQKKKEVENKKRKQNDAINENLQRKIKKRLHAVRRLYVDLENRGTKSVVCLRSLTGCENCNEINSYN